MRDDNDRRFATAMQTTRWQAVGAKKKKDKEHEESKGIDSKRRQVRQIDKRWLIEEKRTKGKEGKGGEGGQREKRGGDKHTKRSTTFQMRCNQFVSGTIVTNTRYCHNVSPTHDYRRN